MWREGRGCCQGACQWPISSGAAKHAAAEAASVHYTAYIITAMCATPPRVGGVPTGLHGAGVFLSLALAGAV